MPLAAMVIAIVARRPMNRFVLLTAVIPLIACERHREPELPSCPVASVDTTNWHSVSFPGNVTLKAPGNAAGVAATAGLWNGGQLRVLVSRAPKQRLPFVALRGDQDLIHCGIVVNGIALDVFQVFSDNPGHDGATLTAVGTRANGDAFVVNAMMRSRESRDTLFTVIRTLSAGESRR